MDQKNGGSNNNLTYVLRILAAIYLLYIDYTFIKDWQQLSNKIIFAAFMVVFAIVAILLIIFSVKGLLKDKLNKK